MKKIRKIINSNKGVVGIVTALLLIGLCVSVIAFIQTVYVPTWMEQKESEHMGDLANQFGQLKFSIDTLSVIEKQNSKISTPITLGSAEIPFLQTMRSYGSLNILPNDCRIEIIDDNNISVTHILGLIKYTSDNSYYLEQSYIYENGALILNQLSSELMTVDPSISIINEEDISFEIIKLKVVGKKSSASGFGTYPIQVKFLNSKINYINNVKNISFITENKHAWSKFFEDLLSESTLDFSISNTENDDRIIINFNKTNNTYYPDLTLIITEIEVQISPGFIN